MKKSKIVIFTLLMTLPLCLLFVAPALAYQNSNFQGRTFYNWSTVSYNLHKDGNGSGTVTWRRTDRPSHRQWFRMMQSSSHPHEFGRRLIPQVNDGSYAIPNTAGYGPNTRYDLQSCREHIFNPVTRIAGTWSAD